MMSTRRGREALDAGDFKGAEHHAKRRLIEEPSDVDAQEVLFESLLARGEIGDARVAGGHLLELHPDDLSTRLRLTQIELSLGCPDRALELLSGAPSNDRAVAALSALAHERLNHPHTASQLRQYATTAAPIDGPGIWQEYFSGQLSALLQEHGQGDGAAAEISELLNDLDLEAAVEPAGQWLQAHRGTPLGDLALADWHMLHGNGAAAEELLELGHFGGKWAGAAWNRLGDAALLRGDLGQARERFRKATLLDPDDLNAWLDLARTEVVLGDRKRAHHAVEEARARTEDPEMMYVSGEFLLELSESPDSASDEPGIFGLAWWPGGGGILAIETSLIQGQSLLRVTGGVGTEMRESAAVAFQYLRDAHGLFEADGAHVHFPNWTIRKEGASAGLAIAAALYQLSTGTGVTVRIGLTGEITLRGDVYPIGGLRGKVTAAVLHGVQSVVYPLANRAEMLTVPARVRRSIDVTAISHFNQLERVLWP